MYTSRSKRKRHDLRINSSFLWIALLFTSCTTSLKSPDLGELYNQSIKYHGIERNPLIVIPGTLGSKLVDSNTRAVVWGAFDRSAINPEKR
ncbi:MAG: hypothetical protein GKR87_12730 [Kiritimatiellae bacterium]|nr:hypothetical protein [Kiritimatiellia bacterium]